jgi:4,5-dihydroxyphthalate decarboxylase
MGVTLSFCCDDSDLTRPLLDGTVSPDGIDLRTETEYPPKRHRRFVREGAWDVAELCLASTLAAHERPEAYPFTALPVFPSRKFRHSFCYMRSDADIDEPADLAGKRVGVQSWQTAANVWMRGIAAEHHGLDLTEVTWYRRRADDVPMEVPDRFDVREIAGAQGGDGVGSATDMRDRFFAGDLDAVMDPSSSFFRAVLAAEDAELLFDDPKGAEKRYFEATGIHPPMHVVAVRDRLLEAEPWIAESLFEAFETAREVAVERNRRPSYNMLQTWAHLHGAEQDRLLGKETWSHGLTEKNREEVATFVEYAHQQGIVEEQIEVRDLFADVS